MLIFIGAVMLVGLVILHELGHFFAAKRAGVKVEEFGIGFPPKAKSLGKRNGTEYTLNWLPLGGFVRLKGEHDSDKSKGAYGAAKLSDKIKIMVSGVVVNLITALFIMTIVAMAGLPKFLDNQFTVDSDTTVSQHDILASFVDEGSPAAYAGIESGDKLLSISEAGDCQNCELYEIKEFDDLSNVTRKFAGREATVVFEDRESSEVKSSTVLFLTTEEVEKSQDERANCLASYQEGDEDCPYTRGYLGVVPAEYIEQKSTWSAPIVATVVSGQIIQETVKSFGNIVADLFKGDTTTASEQVTGVVGIGYILEELSSQGFVSVLFLVAVISLSLAVMNILPIPALDGGRLFVTLLFRVMRKPLTKETEERIHGTGFMLLMLIFVLITVVDVQRFIIN